MSKLRVHSFSISIDGYGAGPDQDLENPLGVRGLSFAPSPNLSQRERRLNAKKRWSAECGRSIIRQHD